MDVRWELLQLRQADHVACARRPGGNSDESLPIRSHGGVPYATGCPLVLRPVRVHDCELDTILPSPAFSHGVDTGGSPTHHLGDVELALSDGVEE